MKSPKRQQSVNKGRQVIDPLRNVKKEMWKLSRMKNPAKSDYLRLNAPLRDKVRFANMKRARVVPYIYINSFNEEQERQSVLRREDQGLDIPDYTEEFFKRTSIGSPEAPTPGNDQSITGQVRSDQVFTPQP